MNTKMKWRVSIDVLMFVTLIFLMSYQVTGEFLHEVFGTGMMMLFLVHHVLNIRWYGNLCRGKYSLQRFVGTVLNTALLVSMLSLAYSGIILSRHVFAFLPLTGGMALSRVMHLAASYWGFVLMGLHTGMHWGAVMGIFRRLMGEGKVTAAVWAACLAAAGTAVYGAACFCQADIFSSYMLLKNEFVFFDYEKSAALVLAQHMAMMGFWIFTGYYMHKGTGKLQAVCRKKKK